MWNSCKSVLANTCAWEQQEAYKVSSKSVMVRWEALVHFTWNDPNASSELCIASANMSRRVLLVVLLCLRLLAVELLSNAEPLLPSQCLLERSSDPVFDGVGLAGFKSRAIAFLLA